jgi:hypothetical protein
MNQNAHLHEYHVGEEVGQVLITCTSHDTFGQVSENLKAPGLPLQCLEDCQLSTTCMNLLMAKSRSPSSDSLLAGHMQAVHSVHRLYVIQIITLTDILRKL